MAPRNMEVPGAPDESAESLSLNDRPCNYDLLEPGGIRVLVLHTGAGDDLLSRHLESVRLDEEARYKAISYAWSEPEFVDELRTDGSLLKITTPRNWALRHFRNAGQPVGPWPDAVCINQQPGSDHDSMGKDLQVATME